MRALAFDSSGPYVAAALFAGGDSHVRVEPMARGQGERLMPLLEELLAEAGADWSDLTALGVGTGPGNFTGIRISVGAARGLSLGLGIPAYGYSLFDLSPGETALPAPAGMGYLGSPGSDPALVPAAEVPPGAWSPLAAEAPEALAEARAELVTRMAEAALAETSAPARRPTPLYIRPPDAAPPKLVPPPRLP
ncbi:tRNA (adenosine(37)-N6)-threonylcarbamoyltransferase complex dimerization subunit type 1 TsaB [Pseudoroseicyclus tamaricis]|uniref:tRNA (Adenosine(37)-N6)-threonylcarbamoyltransferase complex dimerization subunit type 1 TsaB n=1 Tax=Pseudoroseicyclus tamaricis TaxID=2705421 RepID=A0A6B2JPL3_9RHOB|nr:tRNA (adenosine(37)-N6)-threonylcarbamoyltransferase complex dimerization subunit type 1 TsaB [Pseudoroseicyclus tamaricis]NDU99894.1 tRNA (adenosine(37)-N6)-threonylcarbamoyltransferase complex dimerization subunit type 1 TsaB [Pseudoroseicyclus tamaricis]